ncbi:MAG: threonine/serine exporter family protein [Clostridiales bacterium]|nr:threonine/serine exporter family protein [Clostridiales bacterium]
MSKFRQQHMSILWHDTSEKDSDRPSLSSPLSEKAGLIGRVGLMFLSYGAGAFRVRAAMNKISRALNVTCNADIGLKSIDYTCIEKGETCTNALSNVTTGVNTDKLHYMEIFCDGFTERACRYSIDDFHKMLDTIEKGRGNYKLIQLSLAAGIACSAFAFLLGAGAVDMVCALIAAFFGFMVRKLLLNKKITLFANTGAGVFTSCVVYIIMVKILGTVTGSPMDFRAGYICSMLFVIPGFPLITGGIDLAKLDLKSGIERITYSVLVIGIATLSASFAAAILMFAPVDFEPYTLPLYFLIPLRFIMSFLGVFGFSVIFNSRFKMASIAGLIGAIANVLRLLLTDLGVSLSIAAFFGALAAGLMASAIKNYIGFPRITLTIPSIVIMVPGMFMYKGIFFFYQSDFATGLTWLAKALIVVVSLPLGLVFARILTDRNFRKTS